VNSIAASVVDAAFAVHSGLGPGLLESVYEVCLAHEIEKRGLHVRRQVALPIHYDELRFDAGLRLDILVEECLIAELKAVETLAPVHGAAMTT
jgi:GxxExxY protein